jgi:DNA replication and repair protein RecF
MISALTMLRFRSHPRTELAFDGRPVAIWGPNGAGKTNILEAVSLLSPGRGLRRAAADDIARRPDPIGWKLRATAAGHEIETGAEPRGAREITLDGKPAPQSALGRILRMIWLVPSMDRLWIEGADGRRRFLDRLTLSFAPGHAEATLAYEKAMRERNRLLRDEVRDPAWYGALEAQMAASGAEIDANRRQALAAIRAAQDEGGSAFPVAELALDLPPLDPEALAGALARGRAADMAAGRTLAGPHRDDLRAIYAAKGMAAAECSTGEQKALLLSLMLANARALRHQPVVLLLDEVAAHLDAGRRAMLYDEVSALGAHVFMTGTGAELFAGLGVRAQQIEVTDTGEGSRVEQRSLP